MHIGGNKRIGKRKLHEERTLNEEVSADIVGLTPSVPQAFSRIDLFGSVTSMDISFSA